MKHELKWSKSLPWLYSQLFPPDGSLKALPAEADQSESVSEEDGNENELK